MLGLSVFLVAAVIGFGLSVVPLFVHDRLGFGPTVVGASVGVQFLATVLTRPRAGRLADERGGAHAMRIGAACCAMSGLGLIAAGWATFLPSALRLLLLLSGRLVLGCGESQLVVGALGWGIGLLGPALSGRVLAVVGMAMYGALGAGAPLGLVLDRLGGLFAVGAATILLPLAALLLGMVLPPAAPRGGTRPPFLGVLRLVSPHGTAVALQGVGFAVIGAFVTLDFHAHGWPRPGSALAAFGGAFVVARIVAGHLPDRFGGYGVAIVSFAIESAGQAVLLAAGSAPIALIGSAVTGAGCSMVFPSLGVEVVRRIGPARSGTALGGFAAFQDISYGLSGPLAGLLVSHFGDASPFALGLAAALAGLGTTVILRARASRGDAASMPC